MMLNIDNPFTEHFVTDEGRTVPLRTEQVEAGSVQFRPTRDIPTDSASWEQQGFGPIGWCEFTEKGNRMGISHLAREQAASVGASVVLFQFTPAKVRSIQKGPDGRIDMLRVLADPPAGLSPRGTYVVQAVFLARSSASGRDA